MVIGTSRFTRQSSIMKTVFVLTAMLVLVSMTSVNADHFRKRQLYYLSLGSALYDFSKDDFNKLNTGVDFDNALSFLIPHVTYSMSEAECAPICMTGAPSTDLAQLGVTSYDECNLLCTGAIGKCMMSVAVIGK